MIKPDELNLYKKLQPLFREKMGDIKFGDHVSFKNEIGIVTDRHVSQDSNGRQYSIINAGFGWIEDQYLTLLPLSIDPVNPERGLLGMCEYKPTLVPCFDGKLWFAQWWPEDEEHQIEEHQIEVEGNTPTLALLRALEAQMEGRK